MSTLNTYNLKSPDSANTNLALDASGNVAIQAGSASAPSVYVTGDANTGLYSPGADQVALTTGGTARLYIDSSGRVGIGTTTVDSPLHVVAANGAPLIKGAASTGTNACYMQLENTAGGFIVGRDNSSGGILGGGAYASHLYSQGAYPLVFSTNSTQRAQIDSSGRLLVGTSTSVPVLSGSTGAAVQVNSNNHSAYAQTWFYGANNQSGAAIMLAKSRNTTYGSYTAVQSGDSLGGLYWAGDDGSDLNNQAASILCWVDGTPGTDDMPGRLVFSTTADGASSPTERMRITNGGWFKASNTGTYTYAQSSHEMRSNVNDFVVTATNSNATPFGIQIYHVTDANGTGNEFLYCYAGSTLRASIRSNGGLANFSANNANLSDRNAKKDISPATGTWDCIKQWEIVNYRYKDQPDDADLNLGVIAQQVAESCPEVITVFEEAKEAKPAVLDDDGNEVEPEQKAQPEKLGVKEQQMYWMAIKALQEAQVRIEALEAEVAALKAA